jgi:hypothetical protein
VTDTAIIKSIADEMNKSSDRYDEKALAIWNMLSLEEQEHLTAILKSRPIFDGYVVKDPIRAKLVEAGLATRTTHRGEEGYTVGTFVGYAAWKRGSPKDPNITLPGEPRS